MPALPAATAVDQHNARRRYVSDDSDDLHARFPDEFVAISDDGEVLAHAPTIEAIEAQLQERMLSVPHDVSVEFIGAATLSG